MADLNICPFCGDCDGDHDNPLCPAYRSPDDKLKADRARKACNEMAAKIRERTAAMTPAEQRRALERLAHVLSEDWK